MYTVFDLIIESIDARFAFSLCLIVRNNAFSEPESISWSFCHNVALPVFEAARVETFLSDSQ